MILFNFFSFIWLFSKAFLHCFIFVFCFFWCCIEFNKWIIQLNISYIFLFDRPKDQHDFVLFCVHVVHILCAIWNMIKRKKQFDYHDLARDRWKISSFHRNISIRRLITCNLTTHTHTHHICSIYSHAFESDSISRENHSVSENLYGVDGLLLLLLLG